jgi:hypothetical protein
MHNEWIDNRPALRSKSLLGSFAHQDTTPDTTPLFSRYTKDEPLHSCKS